MKDVCLIRKSETGSRKEGKTKENLEWEENKGEKEKKTNKQQQQKKPEVIKMKPEQIGRQKSERHEQICRFAD